MEDSLNAQGDEAGLIELAGRLGGGQIFRQQQMMDQRDPVFIPVVFAGRGRMVGNLRVDALVIGQEKAVQLGQAQGGEVGASSHRRRFR